MHQQNCSMKVTADNLSGYDNSLIGSRLGPCTVKGTDGDSFVICQRTTENY